MDADGSLVFYDIASDKPLRTIAPNPWKTRFALNYKQLPYRTEWIQMPDIAALREGLGVAANRTGPTGAAYHTLPLVKDVRTGKLIGDSFEIALYLDSTYPELPRLMKPQTIGLTAAFNANVDAVFTKYSILCTLRFDPAVQDAIMAMFMARAAVMGIETLQLDDKAREQMFVGFEAALGELAKAYSHVGGTTDWSWRPQGTDLTQHAQRPPPGREQAGVFLDGSEPAYSDFVVGAWLKMMQAGMTPQDWQRLKSWQDGLWGRIVDALKPWSEIK